MLQVRWVTVVFRLGDGNLGVAQNTYIVHWFYGHELNMVFGLQLSFDHVVCCICFVFLKSPEEFQVTTVRF